MTREEAREAIKEAYGNSEYTDEIIKALEQEPFINKPCISTGICEHDKQKVLDKIRAEIEERVKTNQHLNIDRANALCWCLDVIDKYRAESEGNE